MLLPSSRWRCCHSQCAGVFAIVTMMLYCAGAIANIAQALFLFLHRRCHPYCPDLFHLTLHGHCHPCCTVLLPPLSWHVCAIALVLLPLSRWHCCPWYTGISVLVVQASLPLLSFLRAVNSQQASLPSLSWHVLSRGQRGRPCRRQRQHQRNKGNGTSTARAVMPAQ